MGVRAAPLRLHPLTGVLRLLHVEQLSSRRKQQMRWRKGTTYWPAFAGTSEMLSEMLPKAVKRQQSSLTISTRCWTFSTTDAMERFLSDLKAIVMHQEMVPRTRTYLWSGLNPTEEVFEVWMVEDKCPPSTQLELEPEVNVGPRFRGPSSCAERVNADGEAKEAFVGTSSKDGG